MASTNTVYLFSHEYTEGHSLLKFDISFPQNQQEEEEDGHYCNVSSPQLIRHLYTPNDQLYREFMGCGLFDSKLYILGGVILDQNSRLVVNYPRDVMVFDPAVLDADAALDRVSAGEMNSPKMRPRLFEVGGKLYVLGDLVEDFNASCIPVPVPGPNIFEEYDPETKVWTILPPPPIEDEVGPYYFGFAFVSASNKIVVQGAIVSTLHIFDPATSEWTNMDFYTEPEWFAPNNCVPTCFDDCVYWPIGGGSFVKIGPFVNAYTNVESVSHTKAEQVSIESGDRDSNLFSKQFIYNPPSVMMINLGDGKLCLVESSGTYPGNAYIDPGSYHMSYHIYIHKLVEQPDKGSSLRSKLLHTASFRVETGADWVGPFSSCHLLSSNEVDGSDPKRRKL